MLTKTFSSQHCSHTAARIAVSMAASIVVSLAASMAFSMAASIAVSMAASIVVSMAAFGISHVRQTGEDAVVRCLSVTFPLLTPRVTVNVGLRLPAERFVADELNMLLALQQLIQTNTGSDVRVSKA